MGDGFGDRMISARGTEDRLCYAPGVTPPLSELERFRQATHLVSRAERYSQVRALIPSPQSILAKQRSYEEGYKKLLADAGLTEQDFAVVVAYVREQMSTGATVSGQSLEDRIRALHPPPRRFPGTVDVRQYNVGLFPRTEITCEFFLTAARECLKLENFMDCFGSTISMALDFMPIIGNIKGLIEAYTGEDLITGDRIPDWARCLNVTLAVLPGAGAAWKAIRAGLRATQRGSRLAVKALLPLATVIAISRATPAESLRIIDEVANFDQKAIRAAAKEAEMAGEGLLSASKAQDAAVRELSRALAADQIADIEKAIAENAKAAKAESQAAKALTNPGKTTSNPWVPGMPGAVPGSGSGPGRKPRSPGRKPRRRPKKTARPKAPTAVEKTQAYDDVGFERRAMGERDPHKPWGEYQTRKTGKPYEQSALLEDGREVRLDDLEFSKANPETLDLIDYKHSKDVADIEDILEKSGNKYDDRFFRELDRSGHWRGFADKIDQFLRQAQLILENPDSLGRIIIRCSDGKTAYIYESIVANIYGNIYTKVGRKWIKSESLEKIIDAVKVEVSP